MLTFKIDEEYDVLTVEDFRKCCENGEFSDYDGFGYWTTSGKVGTNVPYENEVFPSAVTSIPQHATHVVWYNR